MLGRQSVPVTYARKRRRIQNVNKKLLSSSLEVLPPQVDDLTRSQMARRMLKRSRRVALAEHLEDKNVEHIREHLAKRIKRSQDRVSSAGAEAPFDTAPQDNILFNTPFPSPGSAHELAIAGPLVPEQLSPVPVVKRAVSRTSSMNLKENGLHSQTLASPFCSRPGSVASSPKRNGKGQSSRRAICSSLRSTSRTLLGIFKENVRRVSRKGSTVSLTDTREEPAARRIKHQRYPSSPSASYMRSQFAQEDWSAPYTFDDYNEVPSPGGFVHSDASFYVDHPQFCSTPARNRLQRLSDLRRHRGTNNFLDSFSSRKNSAQVSVVDVEMKDGIGPRRQTSHLFEKSIFSSSDKFMIGTVPVMRNGGTVVEKNGVTGQDEAPACFSCQISTHCEAVDQSQAGHSLVGSFVTEYDIPIADSACSPVSTVATKIVGPDHVPKLSVGKRLIGLPSTSPVHSGNLVIRRSTNPVTSTLPALSLPATITCPSSPASDLALEFGSMDLHGDPDVHTDGKTRRSPASMLLQARSPSLHGVSAGSTTKKAVKRRPATRDRANTIRASDFSKPVSVPRFPASSQPNMRRTRSGTVVGPNSKLATKVTSPVRLVAVPPGPEPGSDDELLLKAAWVEDLEYLGLEAPYDRQEVEADEMNLGGLWHGLEIGPPRRLGLGRR